jgi:hypothetical protein
MYFAAIVASRFEMGQRARILMLSLTLWLPVLKCLATGWFIIANDCMPMLTKPCPERSSSFPDCMRYKMQLVRWEEAHMKWCLIDMVLRFWCQNGDISNFEIERIPVSLMLIIGEFCCSLWHWNY